MRREEPIQRQAYGELLTVKHTFVHCRNHVETRSSLEIPDNLFKALSPIEDNSNKIILFLKLTNLYNSILENQCIYLYVVMFNLFFFVS